MKILFIHSGAVITGSVTYARALEQSWRQIHRVYWANDGFSLSERRGLVVGLRHQLFPRSLMNMFRIVRYVNDKKIQLLHAHSRRANLAAALVSRLTRIPYVVTAHMRTRSRPANRILPCWGDRTIAICETVETHLLEKNQVPPERIRLIRNGIDLDGFRADAVPPLAHPESSERWITILGRLSGKRWHAARFLLSLVPEIARDFPDVRIQFVGWVDPVHEAELQDCVQDLNAGCRRPRVVLTGHTDDPRPLIKSSVLVIAAGRSLMESMAMEMPVIAVGEQASYGLLTPDNFREAQKSNFGDFPRPGEEGFDAAQVMRGIRSVLEGSVNISMLKHWGRDRIAEDYALSKIARQVEDVYASIPRHLFTHGPVNYGRG